MTRTTALRAAVAVAIGALLPLSPAAFGMIPGPPTPGPSPTPNPVHAAYDGMTAKQRVGQLFMVGVATSGPSGRKLSRLQRLDVGSVILDGNSSAGRTAVSLTTARIDTALTESGTRPFIATDQEGGEVQRLTGPGFSRIPSALRQGRWSVAKLRHRSAGWAQQLSAAGISVNLAPVADTVPAGHPHTNQPIGRYDREYGHTPTAVGRHIAAVVHGEAPHVAVTIKHFPGLGRATGNTDLAAHVTDPTTRHDAYLAPFRRGVAAGTPFAMVSLATYPHIDPRRPACFSAAVIEQMLRHAMGFSGVVISDSFHAKAVRSVPAARAATRFFHAGGTMLLDTDSAPIHAMERAVLARARAHPTFAAAIKADVLDVLAAKSDAGLLSTVQP